LEPPRVPLRGCSCIVLWAFTPARPGVLRLLSAVAIVSLQGA